MQASTSPGKGKPKRYAIYALLLCIAAVIAGISMLILPRQVENTVPPINSMTKSASGLGYPYALVPDDTTLNFPTAEGRLLNMDTDTWFLEGILEGQNSGRRYSFIVVYYFSQLYGIFPFNFYSLTLYDLDKAEYGTYTNYDVGSMHAATGYLDLRAQIEGEEAVWTTALDKDGALIPYEYSINLPGIDQQGRHMRLEAELKALNPPVAVGADKYHGRITVLKQDNTYSYFQTGIQFEGTLDWGDIHEPVKGTLGHIDRQMFPEFSSVKARSWDARDLSHEWRTYFLDNGMDFSSWRQFDRMDRNSEYSYGGATIYTPERGARYVGDIVYENLSYVRTENHPVAPLLPPRSDVLYFPNRHRLSSASLGLELQADPIVNAPMLDFPVEYMHGPVMLNGTLQGQPIKGIGSFEMTLHLYRGFELVTVLSDSVRHLPPDAVPPSATAVTQILGHIADIGNALDSDEAETALTLGNGELRVELQTLAEPYRSNMLQILDDLIAAIGHEQ